MRRGFGRWLAAAAALLAARPAAAVPLPSPEQIATPAEQPALRQLQALLVGGATPAERRTGLDAILAQLRSPTALRGYVQFLRANALYGPEQVTAARRAIEESIRLLPGYSAPLYFASIIEGYADQPAQATDYLLRAAGIDPDIVATYDSHNLNSLVSRLRATNDQARLTRLAERLFDVGWRGDDLSLRSSLAREVIRARLAAGQLDRARGAIANLVVPADARALLIDNDYRAIWPDIETWAGPRFSTLWPFYLREARSRWAVRREPRFASNYAAALAAAGHDRTLIATLQPILMGPLSNQDYYWLYVASPFAGALARQGRWAEIERFYAHAMETWAPGSEANALNLSANRPRFRLMAGDARAALEGMDAAIADSARWQGQVSSGALAQMHLYRVCALHQLGRGREAASSIAFVERNGGVEVVVAMNLCLERPARARAVMIGALAVPAKRAEALALVQPADVSPPQGAYGAAMHARWLALRNDPVLRAAVARHGRILPYPLNAGAPAEAAAP